MTRPADRDALVEVMARANHNKWRDEWIALGRDPETVPTWEMTSGMARNASRRAQAAVLSSIEASGCAVMPIEATDDMLSNLASPTPDVDYTAMVLASPYRSDK